MEKILEPLKEIDIDFEVISNEEEDTRIVPTGTAGLPYYKINIFSTNLLETHCGEVSSKVDEKTGETIAIFWGEMGIHKLKRIG